MVFNPDITKQAVEVIFSVKNKKRATLNLYLLIYYIYFYLSLEKIAQNILGRISTTVLTLSNILGNPSQKLRKESFEIPIKFVDRKVLDMCYKLYVRPHFDYGDVIYHYQRTDLMNLIEQG